MWVNLAYTPIAREVETLYKAVWNPSEETYVILRVQGSAQNATDLHAVGTYSPFDEVKNGAVNLNILSLTYGRTMIHDEQNNIQWVEMIIIDTCGAATFFQMLSGVT